MVSSMSAQSTPLMAFELICTTTTKPSPSSPAHAPLQPSASRIASALIVRLNVTTLHDACSYNAVMCNRTSLKEANLFTQCARLLYLHIHTQCILMCTLQCKNTNNQGKMSTVYNYLNTYTFNVQTALSWNERHCYYFCVSNYEMRALNLNVTTLHPR